MFSEFSLIKYYFIQSIKFHGPNKFHYGRRLGYAILIMLIHLVSFEVDNSLVCILIVLQLNYEVKQASALVTNSNTFN